MVQGQVFLKGGLVLFLFDLFKVYYFYILKLFYSLQKCVIYLKEIFFLPRWFFDRSHSKLSENEPLCICKKGWCVRLGQEGVSYQKGEGNCLKYPKRGEIEKDWEQKIKKGGANLGWGVVALKRSEHWNPLTNYEYRIGTLA